jgi:hypothetical protein
MSGKYKAMQVSDRSPGYLKVLGMRHSFTRQNHALLLCLTSVQADPLRYRKISAVPLARSHIFVVRATGSLTL